MDVVDLEPGDPRLGSDVLPVLRQLRPQLTTDAFLALYAEGFDQGLRFTAVFVDGRCVAVAGWRIVVTAAAGRKLYVDDLVTAEDHRGEGMGRHLLTTLTERARAARCAVLDLDSGVQRTGAHRFYMREGMTISSFHFIRPITG